MATRLICWLKGQWYSIPSVLRGSSPIEGHNYEEVFNDGNVQVLKCMDCGNQSAAWHTLIQLDAVSDLANTNHADSKDVTNPPTTSRPTNKRTGDT